MISCWLLIFSLFVYRSLVAEGCGTEYSPTSLSAGWSSRSLNTPSYPSDYNNNQRCFWLIEAGVGETVGYSFDTDFRLESCPSDYVKLYDDRYQNVWNFFGKYCGSRTPVSGRTTGRYLLVYFYSDSSAHYKGFRLNFAADRIPPAGSGEPVVRPGTKTRSSAGPGPVVIALIVVGVVTLLFCCCCCSYACCRNKYRNGAVRNPTVVTGPEYRPGSQPHPQQPAYPPAQGYPQQLSATAPYSMPPPSYSMPPPSEGQGYPPHSAPPTYNQLFPGGQADDSPFQRY